MKSILAIAVLAVVGLTQNAQAQDVAAGAQVFRKCQICHAIGPHAKNRVGPELNGLDGRHSGSVAGYHYSDANKKSGIVWNEETFEKYIKNPRAMIPGTKMMFAGITRAKDVDNLWAYVKQFGADGKKK